MNENDPKLSYFFGHDWFEVNIIIMRYVTVIEVYVMRLLEVVLPVFLNLKNRTTPVTIVNARRLFLIFVRFVSTDIL